MLHLKSIKAILWKTYIFGMSLTPKKIKKSQSMLELEARLKLQYEMSNDLASKYLSGTESQEVHRIILTTIGQDSVVEVGCGPGILAGSFSPESYLGLDISESLLSIAKSRHPKHTFQQINALKLEKKLGITADFVFAKSILEHQEKLSDSISVIDKMLLIADKQVMVIWHTPPKFSQLLPQERVTKGHFGVEIFQSSFPRWVFEILFSFKVLNSGPHQVWTFAKDQPVWKVFLRKICLKYWGNRA
jgi:SAM-dependent methyltransferase